MSRGRLLAWCLAAGTLFSFAWILVSWFVDERLIYLMAPGAFLLNLAGRWLPEVVAEWILLLSNGAVWGLLFYAVALQRRRRPGAALERRP